jgi:predicted ABC-type ATPase
MYRKVRSTKVNGLAVDLGVYVNPDDIARELRMTKRFDFARYEVVSDEVVFGRFARSSGLIPTAKDELWFMTAQQWGANVLKLRRVGDAERFAQIIAQHVVELLLQARKKFSFETVFSHASKVEAMKRAEKLGYKVYLYFISTNDPEINKDRVRIRVAQGGHDVPPDRVEQRYYRSLGLLRDAVRHSYHAFMFDNSGSEPLMFGEYKNTPEQPRQWLFLDDEPMWFTTNYMLVEGTNSMRLPRDREQR